jgi:heme/copper-type cytochrome/quinol oxidase subunit 1
VEPEIYILIIPEFGIISHIIASKRDKKETFGTIGIMSLYQLDY